MKINICSWNVRGLNRISKRILVKSCIQKWRADVYCFQETKLEKDVEFFAKQLWGSKWMRCGYLEAEGSRGGIIMLWDSRLWTGVLIDKRNLFNHLQFHIIPTFFQLVSHWLVCTTLQNRKTSMLGRNCNIQRTLGGTMGRLW